LIILDGSDEKKCDMSRMQIMAILSKL